MAASGYTPIQLYYSTTAAAVPTSGNLANGELAINITDGKLYYKSNAGVVTLLAGATAGPAGGSNTQVQFNSSGVLAGDADLTFDGTTLTANALTVTNAVTLSGGTANGVTYLNGSKVLTSGSALTWSGTLLSATTSVSGNSNVLSLINSNTAAGGQGVGIFGYSSNGSNSLGSIQFGGEGSLGGNLDFSTANGSGTNTLNMRLSSGGNLGIGTSSPSTKLDVSGNAKSNGYTFNYNTSYWNVDGYLSNYSATNGVYLNGNASGWLNLNGDGTNVTAIKVYGSSHGTPNIITFNTASSERMRLDASGNLGIGTTSPSNRVSIVTASGSDGIVSVKSPTTETAGILIDGGSTSNKGALLTLAKDATTKWRIGLDSAIGGGTNNNLNILGSSTDALLFGTNATERARIDASGNLLVGTTSFDNLPGGGTSKGTGAALGGSQIKACRSAYTVQVGVTTTGSGIFLQQFFQDGSNTGQIVVSNSNTTGYQTSSDYRLKDNPQPLTGALEKVSALKPCTWTWKNTGEDGQGFIAHELQAVVPDAVSGEKDGVDEDGKPKYQGVDTSFLVATLTAAIQEQQALIQSLKARLDAANL